MLPDKVEPVGLLVLLLQKVTLAIQNMARPRF
jgi:hypothetical protein